MNRRRSSVLRGSSPFQGVQQMADLTSATTSFDTIIPQNTALGDVVLCFIALDLNTITIAPPSGWTFITDAQLDTSSKKIHAYRFIYLGGDRFHAWTLSAAPTSYGHVTLVCLRGISTVTQARSENIASGITWSFPPAGTSSGRYFYVHACQSVNLVQLTNSLATNVLKRSPAGGGPADQFSHLHVIHQNKYGPYNPQYVGAANALAGGQGYITVTVSARHGLYNDVMPSMRLTGRIF